MTFQLAWWSFWCGVGGGCLGYYATHWLDRLHAGWRYRRNARWFVAQARSKRIEIPRSAWRPGLGIHTGFDDGD